MAYKNYEDQLACQRRHYAANKEKYLEKNRRLRARNYAFLKELKSKLKCSVCGEDHIACLDFHHRNPEEKEYTIGEIPNRCWSIKRIQEEIDKCDVLCANCHRKFHYNDEA
ncbi:MAG: hypothetical protein WDA59_05510 [Methanofastidiosum sp.]|jgi:hypothetical protein